MSLPKLLVVDDNQQVGEVVIELATMLGYDTRYTDNFFAFESEAQGWEPSVIVTDLQMPALDGIELFRRLSAARCKSKIIIISGMSASLIGMAERIGRERGLDVVASFQKPFNVLELSNALRGLKPAAAIPAGVLLQAIQEDEIETFFQAKYRLANREVAGAEVLARWNHPTYGAVPPSTFMPIVGQSGLSALFLQKTMNKALRHAAQWPKNSTSCPIAINISSYNVSDLDLPDSLKCICDMHGVPCDRIVLELTESDWVEMSADTLDVLTRLRLKGFQLSIDDFGTGFSSLQRLREMPFTELKIDRSFVAGMGDDAISSVIVRSIISLSKQLGLACVAEGIENQETERLLIGAGCEYGQGYDYSEPLPPFLFHDFLSRSQSKHRRALATASADVA